MSGYATDFSVVHWEVGDIVSVDFRTVLVGIVYCLHRWWIYEAHQVGGWITGLALWLDEFCIQPGEIFLLDYAFHSKFWKLLWISLGKQLYLHLRLRSSLSTITIIVTFEFTLQCHLSVLYSVACFSDSDAEAGSQNDKVFRENVFRWNDADIDRGSWK